MSINQSITLILIVMRDEFIGQLLLYFIVLFGLFLVSLYIFRSVFNIPTFLKYQRAQIKLLEELAKKQGVDDSKVTSIISESIGWADQR